MTADLEAQNKWDGSWYDLDREKTHTEVQQSRCGLKTFYSDVADEADELLYADDIPKCIRLSSQPVLDNECGQLQPGTHVVVLVKWADNHEQKYYDAEIVSADRQEHPPDERACTCRFRVRLLLDELPDACKEDPSRTPKVDNSIPLDDICFPGSPAMDHPSVKKWLQEIEAKQQELSQPQGSWNYSSNSRSAAGIEAARQRITQAGQAASDAAAGAAPQAAGKVEHAKATDAAGGRAGANAAGEQPVEQAAPAAAVQQAAPQTENGVAAEQPQQQPQQAAAAVGQKRAGEPPQEGPAAKRPAANVVAGAAAAEAAAAQPQAQQQQTQQPGLAGTGAAGQAGVPASVPAAAGAAAAAAAGAAVRPQAAPVQQMSGNALLQAIARNEMQRRHAAAQAAAQAVLLRQQQIAAQQAQQQPLVALLPASSAAAFAAVGGAMQPLLIAPAATAGPGAMALRPTLPVTAITATAVPRPAAAVGAGGGVEGSGGGIRPAAPSTACAAQPAAAAAAGSGRGPAAPRMAATPAAGLTGLQATLASAGMRIPTFKAPAAATAAAAGAGAGAGASAAAGAAADAVAANGPAADKVVRQAAPPAAVAEAPAAQEAAATASAAVGGGGGSPMHVSSPADSKPGSPSRGGRQAVGALAAAAAAAEAAGGMGAAAAAAAAGGTDGEDSIAPFPLGARVELMIPAYATEAQRKYFMDNTQGKPTMVHPGERHGLPRSWFVLERTRTTGVSKGTKDRYYLPPEGRVLRTRAEAEARAWGGGSIATESSAEQLARFNLLVDAAAADADRDSGAPSAAAAAAPAASSGGAPSGAAAGRAAVSAGGTSVQLPGLLGQAAAVQAAIMQRQKLAVLAEQVKVPLRLSDITTMAQLQAQGSLSLLPAAKEALYESAVVLTNDYTINGTLTAVTARELQASLAVLLGVASKQEWAKGVLNSATAAAGAGAALSEGTAAAAAAAGNAEDAMEVDQVSPAGADAAQLPPQQQQQQQQSADVDMADVCDEVQAADAAAAGEGYEEGSEGDEDSPATPVNPKLQAAIVDRVRSWSACSKTYLNMYLQQLREFVSQLEQQQAAAQEARAAVTAAAAKVAAKAAAARAGQSAGGGATGGTWVRHVSASEIDPCVSAMVQRVFDSVTGRAACGRAPADKQQQQERDSVTDTAAGAQAADQQQQQEQQGKEGLGLSASFARGVECQAGKLLEQLDDTLMLLRAEVVSMAPYRKHLDPDKRSYVAVMLQQLRLPPLHKWPDSDLAMAATDAGTGADVQMADAGKATAAAKAAVPKAQTQVQQQQHLGAQQGVASGGAQQPVQTQMPQQPTLGQQLQQQQQQLHALQQQQQQRQQQPAVVYVLPGASPQAAAVGALQQQQQHQQTMLQQQVLQRQRQQQQQQQQQQRPAAVDEALRAAGVSRYMRLPPAQQQAEAVQQQQQQQQRQQQAQQQQVQKPPPRVPRFNTTKHAQVLVEQMLGKLRSTVPEPTMTEQQRESLRQAMLAAQGAQQHAPIDDLIAQQRQLQLRQQQQQQQQQHQQQQQQERLRQAMMVGLGVQQRAPGDDRLAQQRQQQQHQMRLQQQQQLQQRQQGMQLPRPRSGPGHVPNPIQQQQQPGLPAGRTVSTQVRPVFGLPPQPQRQGQQAPAGAGVPTMGFPVMPPGAVRPPAPGPAPSANGYGGRSVQ